jgi:hypothetical protein
VKIHGEKKDFLKVDLAFTTRSDIIQPKNLGAMAMFQFLSTFKFLTHDALLWKKNLKAASSSSSLCF